MPGLACSRPWQLERKYGKILVWLCSQRKSGQEAAKDENVWNKRVAGDDQNVL